MSHEPLMIFGGNIARCSYGNFGDAGDRRIQDDAAYCYCHRITDTIQVLECRTIRYNEVIANVNGCSSQERACRRDSRCCGLQLESQSSTRLYITTLVDLPKQQG
jgi:hypothetical protein